MATVPNPRTWTVGELLTASKMNTDVRDGLNFLLTRPRALMHKTTNQSLTNGTWAALAWNSEQYDNDGGHSDSTNNTRYTVQTAGWWEFIATICFDATSTTGDRAARFLRNGAGSPFGEVIQDSPDSTGAAIVHTTGWVSMSVGDYVEVQGWQNSGAALNQIPSQDSSPSFFAAKWISK